MRSKLSCIGMLAVALAQVAAAAEVKIDKLLPFATDRGVRVVAHVTGEAGAELSGKIVPASGGAALWEGPMGAADAKGAVEKTVDGLQPKLWSPGSPTLYKLTVTAKRNGREVATQTARFGFRSVAARDGHVWLNGHPIFLCGIAINPPERDIPEALGYDPKFVHDYVAYLRSQHVNIIRMTFTLKDDPRQQVWFDACDELGMLVDQGNYASPPTGEPGKKGSGPAVDPEEQPDAFAGKGSSKRATPQNFDASIVEYEKVFETYARHPSIIIYILANELPGPVGSNAAWHEYLTKAYDRLHAWDPSRIFIGNAGYGLGREGDINDVHRYWGWYYNSFLTYYNLRDTVSLFGESTDKQPFTFSECVGSFTSPLGSFNAIYRKQLAAQMGWTGHSPDQKGDSLAYQSFMVKHALESFRTMREQNHRISGLMPFTILFYNWEGIHSFADMKAKPAMEQMGVSYQPVLLSWENWTPNVYAGGKVKVIAHVVNDAEDFSELSGARLEVALTSKAGGPTVVAQSIELPALPYFAAKAIPIDVDAAASVTGDYVLSGKIVRGGQVLSHNETDLSVSTRPLFPREVTPTPKMAVYDPVGTTLAALRRAEFQVIPIADLSKIGDAKHLIVGEMALSKPGAGDALKAFVAAGGRVLCLAQEADKFDSSWLSARIEMLHGTCTNPQYPTKDRPTADQQNVNVERPWHPVFTGVGRERLRLWSDYTGWDQSKPGFPKVLPVTHGFKLTRAEDLSRVAVLADYDRGLEGVALAEFFDGRGSVILTGLDLIPRAGLDPVADQMLGNLVRYLVSADHETQPLVEKPIVWGDYASERGVVTGPVNGLVYNCRWVTPPGAAGAKPMPDNGGAWNTHPGNPFVPVGVRAIGPYGYSTGSSPKEDKEPKGTGEFCCRVPAGRKVVVNKVQNVTKESLSLAVSVNGGKEPAANVPAGQTITIRSRIPNGATDLTVNYAGDKRLVILETAFE